MNDLVPVLKDPEQQALIPTLWRDTLSSIANAIEDGDFHRLADMPDVQPVSENTARTIAENIHDYGVHLEDLPEDTWHTSACQWMGEYWDVLIDLFSVEEGASDLALAVRVYEKHGGYVFEVHSVHVP